MEACCHGTMPFVGYFAFNLPLIDSVNRAENVTFLLLHGGQGPEELNQLLLAVSGILTLKINRASWLFLKVDM